MGSLLLSFFILFFPSLIWCLNIIFTGINILPHCSWLLPFGCKSQWKINSYLANILSVQLQLLKNNDKYLKNLYVFQFTKYIIFAKNILNLKGKLTVYKQTQKELEISRKENKLDKGLYLLILLFFLNKVTLSIYLLNFLYSFFFLILMICILSILYPVT